ncbi:DNA mismatch repair endonuclease MutL [Paenibacillus athensensis]|uniref:DNA mismatch repair protein MutL n=1 Tax=Paenibacillus athensensis TaxID=1967502 RepID=A0A4Y8Q775_9BACL|nr:DNA mismatch repair endonuclease MutL [Paenibacillus athensensis]MCD1257346.1 DNA mismatch repair endonuclease MutL [Paenibacillus athensensis]
MGKIQLLSEHIANQIAAGEVVERPSSVVKELVENAVDAGSARIDIAVEEGGLQLIRVADNGSGMETEDCELAFQRHATSKIATSKDLFAIRTLGFRGEALPSIASVSRLECVTSASDSGLGRRIVIEGGALKSAEETATRRGTEVIVRDLFYNTPARLKYMKTIQTELGHISDYLYRLALAHPGIAFSLKHNGNLLLQTLGNGDLLQVIAAIYGTATGKMMVPVAAESLDYTMTGFIAKPEMTRANRAGMSTVVNGRYVRNFALNQAILQGYHTLLPINRFPVAVLHIAMDPSLVDVNVHPAKLEVRFSKEAELTALIEAEIKRALGRQVLIPQGKPGAAKGAYVQEQLELTRVADAAPELAAGSAAEADRAVGAGGPAGSGLRAGEALAGAGGPLGGAASAAAYGAAGESGNGAPDEHGGAAGRERSDAAAAGGPLGARPNAAFAAAAEADGAAAPLPGDADAPPEPGEAPLAAGLPSGPRIREAAPSYRPQGDAAYAAKAAPGGAGASTGKQPQRQPAYGGTPSQASRKANEAFLDALPEAGGAPKLPAFPQLDPIGQMHGTYIVAQNDAGLYLIDQHAAHERIHYEYYYEKFGNPAEASQELLVPITLEFTPSEAAVILDKLVLLEQAGVYMEAFGGSTFIVRAHPHWFPAGEEQAIVEEMCEWLLSEKKSVEIAKLREKSAILCSCKASIKANQALRTAEMEALLDRLAACRNPYTCPHGRPIVVSFSTYELEKMFKRVM